MILHVSYLTNRFNRNRNPFVNISFTVLLVSRTSRISIISLVPLSCRSAQIDIWSEIALSDAISAAHACGCSITNLHFSKEHRTKCVIAEKLISNIAMCMKVVEIDWIRKRAIKYHQNVIFYKYTKREVSLEQSWLINITIILVYL